MKGRVFLHPRCTSNLGVGVFQAMLEERGFDFDKVCIFQDVKQRNRHELVRRAGYDPVKLESTFERMDGTRFTHPDAPQPEAA